MRIIQPPPFALAEIEVTCKSCQAVLGVTRADVYTHCHDQGETLCVFRCSVCGGHICVSETAFESGESAG